jgi:hypothetical protein
MYASSGWTTTTIGPPELKIYYVSYGLFLPMEPPHEAKFNGVGIRKEVSLTG